MAKTPDELTYPVKFEQVVEVSPRRFPGEVIDGSWVPDRQRHPQHAAIFQRLVDCFADAGRDKKLWSLAIGNPGVKLGREPDTLLGPDIALIPKDRVPAGDGVDGWLNGAPTLAVEIMRVGQTPADADERSSRYLSAGGEVVWQIDPARKEVRVYLERMRQPLVLGEHSMLNCGVIPGFKCRSSELF